MTTYKDALQFARGYLGRKISDEEFRPVYEKWINQSKIEAGGLKLRYKYFSPLGEFLWKMYFKQMTQQEERPIPQVTDTFVQCEKCEMYYRLGPPDELGERTIPLMRSHYTGKRYWLCDNCWDKVEAKELWEL
jgi:hypothetical protein